MTSRVKPRLDSLATSGIVSPSESLGQKLMDMAGYGKISATAFMITAKKENKYLNNKLNNRPVKGKPLGPLTASKLTHVVDKLDRQDRTNMTNASVKRQTDRKIYIPTYLGGYRVIGCLDSGSDITILHMSLFTKVFSDKKYLSNSDNLSDSDLLSESDIPYITTFSDNSVPVQGRLSVPLKLSKFHSGINVPIYVINDIPNVPSFLLGNDLLYLGLGSISYTGSLDDPLPEVVFKYPTVFHCETYFESPSKLFTCQARCTLEPYEVQEVEFVLPPASPVIRTDHILTTSQEWDT
jgi:hypothetical protein